MTAIRLVMLVSLGIGAAVGPLAAEEKWVLWDRPLDAKGERQGDWRRGQVFDTERWCKGAMTTAVNQALSTIAQVGVKPRFAEYQCLPESTDPRTPTGKR